MVVSPRRIRYGRHLGRTLRRVARPLRRPGLWAAGRGTADPNPGAEVDAYIKHWNTKRRHMRLGGRTPEEFPGHVSRSLTPSIPISRIQQTGRSSKPRTGYVTISKKTSAAPCDYFAKSTESKNSHSVPLENHRRTRPMDTTAGKNDPKATII